MKNLYLALMMLGTAIFAQAQDIEVTDSINRTVEEAAFHVFANINMAEVSSGFLIDRSLSALDYGNFRGQPTLLDTTQLRQWRHLYGVFLRNAENETTVWNPDLIQNLQRIDSLMEARGLSGEGLYPCDFFNADGSEWIARYQSEKQYLLDISQNYPPQLPRIRRWLRHIDEQMDAITALDSPERGYTVLNDSNYVDALRWLGMFELLEHAWVGSGKSPLPDSDAVMELLSKAEQDSTGIPLAILDMRLHRLHPHAIDSAWLAFENEQLQPLAASDKYLQHQEWLAAAPLALMLSGLEHEFVLDPALYLSHQAKEIDKVEVDFDDGQGFQLIDWGQSLTISYPEAGTKEIVFRLIYTDCSFAFSHSILMVNEEEAFTANRYQGVPDERFHLIADRAYEGKQAGGTVTIEYGCGNDRLTKPFIIIEGFNPPEYDVFGGNTDYRRFFNSLTPDLRNNLQNAGYDLVYLDYDNGAEPIQRNAYLAQTLIRTINEMKAANGSIEPNVVMGISMGGLVARYALSEMERPMDGRQPEEHDTRLYISMDSPHRGANAPLGMQYMAHHLPTIPVVRVGFDILKRTQFGRDLLRAQNIDPNGFHVGIGRDIFARPATQQLLLQQMSPFYQIEHSIFMQEYHSLGMPENTRNITISNGSQVGEGLDFGDSEELLKIRYFSPIINFNIFRNIMLELNESGVLSDPFTSGVLGSAILLSLNVGMVYLVNFKINTTNSANNFKTLYSGSVFGLLLGYPIAFNSYTVFSKNDLPLDNAPGGSFTLNRFSIAGNNVSLGINSVSHIPTVSALDIDIQNRNDYFMNVLDADIIGNGLTPFDDYASPDRVFEDRNMEVFNERHTRFSEFNEGLLLREVVRDNSFTPVNSSFSNFNFNGEAFYNFTHRTDNRLYSGTIRDGQSLLINNNMLSAFPSSGLAAPEPDQYIRVKASGHSNCNYSAADIQVLEGGEIVVGDNVEGFASELIFTPGTSLVLESGSVLTINSGSSLSMACGTTLVVDKDAAIINNGGTLYINGSIEYNGDDEFPFDYEIGEEGGVAVGNANIHQTDILNCLNESTELRVNNWNFVSEFIISEEMEDVFDIESNDDNSFLRLKLKEGITRYGSVNVKARLQYNELCNNDIIIESRIEYNSPIIGDDDYFIVSNVYDQNNQAAFICPNSRYEFAIDFEQPIDFEYEWVCQGCEITSENGTLVNILTGQADGVLFMKIFNECGDEFIYIDLFIQGTCSSSIRLVAWPVPSDEEMEINIVGEDDEYDFQLLNSKGESISYSRVKNGKIVINTRNYKSGMYFIKVAGSKDQIVMKVVFR